MVFLLRSAEAAYSPTRKIVTVRTRWLSNTRPAVKLFVHVMCNGELVGQSDGYPWLDIYPFAAWQPGELETDIREIKLKHPVDAACLQITTGLYGETTLERLAAKDAVTGEGIENNLVPVSLVPYWAGFGGK